MKELYKPKRSCDCGTEWSQLLGVKWMCACPRATGTQLWEGEVKDHSLLLCHSEPWDQPEGKEPRSWCTMQGSPPGLGGCREKQRVCNWSSISFATKPTLVLLWPWNLEVVWPRITASPSLPRCQSPGGKYRYTYPQEWVFQESRFLSSYGIFVTPHHAKAHGLYDGNNMKSTVRCGIKWQLMVWEISAHGNKHM